MKKAILFTLTLLSFSSAFAISDYVECIGGDGVIVNTTRFQGDSDLILTVQYLSTDKPSVIAKIDKEFGFKSQTFKGSSTDGLAVNLEVTRSSLNGTLSIEGRKTESLVCKERVLLPM